MDILISKQNHASGEHGRTLISRFGLVFFVAVVSLILTACGGGGGGSTPTASAPAVPAAMISFDVKQLNFSWGAVSGADFYKLLENADGASGFSVIQDNITTTSASKTISVVNHNWANARYMVEACNSAGCTASTELNTAGAVLKAIGFVKASNTGINDQFSAQNGGGYSATPVVENSPAIALSGDGLTLVVGASMEDGPDQGIGIDQSTADDGSADNSGAVYVFRHGASGWFQQAYIKASDSAANAKFGMVLALSQDGNTLAVTNGYTAGKVYLFRFAGSSWSEENILSHPAGTNTLTAVSLGLDDNGNSLFVGRPFLASGSGGSVITTAGAISVYRYDSMASTWGAIPVDLRSDFPLINAHLGMSLSVSGDGNVLVTGANGVTVSGNSNAGAAYVFRYDSGSSSWAQEQLLSASNPDVDDDFGRAVALSRDGMTIAISALHEDGAGTGVSNGGTGDTANAANNAGAVYVYRFSSGWIQQAYIKATNTPTLSSDLFGDSLALSRDGNRLVVSASGEASNATGIGGNQSDNSMSFAGAAYQYQFNTTTSAWDTTNIHYIKPAYADSGTSFGRGISLSDDGNTLAVSGDGDDSSATGVAGGDDSTLANFAATKSGTVYLY